MTKLEALAPKVRLLIDSALRDVLVAFDNDRYATFLNAIQFAEEAIAHRLSMANDRLTYLLPFAGLELVIEFCRIRERFVVRAIHELNDDPPPGGSAPRPEATAAMTMLCALGIDSQAAPSWAGPAAHEHPSMPLTTTRPPPAIRMELGAVAHQIFMITSHGHVVSVPVAVFSALSRGAVVRTSEAFGVSVIQASATKPVAPEKSLASASAPGAPTDP